MHPAEKEPASSPAVVAAATARAASEPESHPAASSAAASSAPAIAPTASNLALPRARSYSDDVMSISSSNSSSDEAAAANAARMGVEAAIHMAKASTQIHQLRSTCFKPGGSKLVIMRLGLLERRPQFVKNDLVEEAASSRGGCCSISPPLPPDMKKMRRWSAHQAFARKAHTRASHQARSFPDMK